MVPVALTVSFFAHRSTLFGRVSRKTLSRLRTPVGGVREGDIAYGAPRAARRRNYGRA
jgi:hypothetical protein